MAQTPKFFITTKNQTPHQSPPQVRDIYPMQQPIGPQILDLSLKLQRENRPNQTVSTTVPPVVTAGGEELAANFPQPIAPAEPSIIPTAPPAEAISVHQNPLPLSQKHALVLGFLFLLGSLALLTFRI